MKNILRVGEPRLCHLIDGDPDTPQSLVMLQDTGDAITVTFPIAGLAGTGDGPYDRWWSRDTAFGDDPDRTKFSYSPPPVLLVYDDAGPVVLVGCHATGGSRRTPIAGNGVLVAEFAVLGGRNLKYDKINGMRTSSSAYGRWLGRSSIDLTPKTDSLGRLQSLDLALGRTESVKVSRRLNMTAQWDWEASPVLDGYDVREWAFFQTRRKRPRQLVEHLDRHIGVLDLVSIAAWKDCALREVAVTREDDPARTLGGNEIGARWLTVISHRPPGEDLSDCQGHFLFSCGDMGRSGIDTWLRLRDEYGRALDYLLRILRSGRTWSPQSAILSGVALEQLGYLIEMRCYGGSRLNSRGGLSFKNALGAVLDDMDVYPFPQDDAEDWKERCRRVYMGAKHGDREEVDYLTALNTLRENLLVLRYWIAQRLGVSGEVLQRNLIWDPLRNGFRLED